MVIVPFRSQKCTHRNRIMTVDFMSSSGSAKVQVCMVHHSAKDCLSGFPLFQSSQICLTENKNATLFQKLLTNFQQWLIPLQCVY